MRKGCLSASGEYNMKTEGICIIKEPVPAETLVEEAHILTISIMAVRNISDISAITLSHKQEFC